MNIIIFPRPQTNHVYAKPMHGLNKISLIFGIIAVSAVLLGGGYLLGISYGHKTIINEWKADVSAQNIRYGLFEPELSVRV